MSILIVGGAGYIGSQTAKRVAQAGLEPVVFDNLVYGHKWAVKWGPLVEGDLADGGADPARAEGARGDRGRALRRLRLRRRVGDRPAQVLPQQRRRHAEPAGRDARRGRARHRVLVDLRHLRRAGAHADRRRPPAAARSTPTARRSSRSSARSTGTSAPTRCGSRRCATSTPPAPTPTARSARTTIRRRTSSRWRSRRRWGGKALEIYGTDYPTPDGTAIRDYIHVQDLADAHVAALDRLRDGATSRTVNLGTGRGHSVREVIAAVEKVSGKKVPARETGRRAGDPPALVADPRLAGEILGWKARIPSIEAHASSTRWRWATAEGSGRDRRGTTDTARQPGNSGGTRCARSG